MNRKPLLLLPLFWLFAACGDVGAVSVGLTFPDSATQAATRALTVVTREAPKTGNGCDALWTMQSNGLAERKNTILYPNRNDLVASDVDLSATNQDGSRKYPKLTILVYAYNGQDTSTAQLIAGGCQDVSIADAGSTTTVTIKLQRPPATP